MIATFLSSSSASLQEFLIFCFVTLGLTIVLWGHWLEWKSDKELYSDLNDFRASKRKSKCGKKLVMWGIVLEIIIAIWVVHDAWDTRQMAIKNAPENRPIKSMAIEVNLEIFLTNSPDNGDQELTSFLYLELKNKSGGNIAILGCKKFDDSTRQIGVNGAPNPNIWLYSMDFNWPNNEVSSVLPYELAQKDISTEIFDKEIVGAIVWFPGCKVPLQIARGSCVLTINGSLQRKFLIPNYSDEIFLIDTNRP